jgi:hypothetical protein
LDDFSLPDLFQLIHFGRKSGTLNVTHGDARGYVCFRNGDVYFASHNWKRRLLGQRLVEAGELEQTKLDEALELQEKSGGEQRIGQILIDLGCIDRDTLEEFVEEQIRDSVFNMIRWTEGEFDFDPKELCHNEDIGLSMSTDALIEEVYRRLSEWHRIEKKIPSLEAVFKVVDSPPDDTGGLDMTREEWLVLFEVDGKRSVKEIIEKVGRTATFTCRAIYSLAAAGLITMAGAGISAPVDAPVLLEAQGEESDGRGALEPVQTMDTGSDEEHGEGQLPDSAPRAAPVVEKEKEDELDLPEASAEAQVADGEPPPDPAVIESAPAARKRRREVHREQVWSEPEDEDDGLEEDTDAGGTPAPGQSLVDYYKSLALRDMGDSETFRQTEEKRASIEEVEDLSGPAVGKGTAPDEETGAETQESEPDTGQEMPIEWAGHLTRMMGRTASPPDSVMKHDEMDETSSEDEAQAGEVHAETVGAPDDGTPEPADGELEETFALEEPSAFLDEPDDVFADDEEEYPSGDDMEKMLQATPQPRDELSREELLAFDRPTYPVIEAPDAPKEHALKASASALETVVEVISPEPVLDSVSTGEVAVAEVLAVPVAEPGPEQVPAEVSTPSEPEFVLDEIPLVLGEDEEPEPAGAGGNGQQESAGLEIIGLEAPDSLVEPESLRPAVAEELDFGELTRTADRLAEVEAERVMEEGRTKAEIEAAALEEMAGAEAGFPADDTEIAGEGIIYAERDHLDALREISGGAGSALDEKPFEAPASLEPLNGDLESLPAQEGEQLSGDTGAGKDDSYLDNMKVRGKRGAGTSLVDLETFELEEELLELARGSQEKKTRPPIPDNAEQRKHGPVKEKKKERKKTRGFGRSKR